MKPQSDIPPALIDHLRYPEDLFKVQRDLISRYHVSDTNVFYSGEDFWAVPDEPGAEQRAAAALLPVHPDAGADEAGVQPDQRR